MNGHACPSPAAPARRTPVIMDHSTRRLLWGHTVDHAAPWTAGGDIPSGNRPFVSRIDQTNTMAGDVLRRVKRSAQNKLHGFPASPLTGSSPRIPLQRCVHCSATDVGPSPILRSDLQGWRITCPFCGQPYQDKTTSDDDQTLAPYRAAARRGETMLNNHAERGAETWLSPLEIARLLLMRRVPWPTPRGGDLWRYRLLGVIVPDLRCHSGQADFVSILAKTSNSAAAHPTRAPCRRSDHRTRRTRDAEDASSARAGREQEPFRHSN